MAMASATSPLRRFAPIVLVVALALVPVALPGHFWTYIFTVTLIYAILALGQNVITGWCGMLTLGQAAFLGVGAYTSAILVMRLGVPWPLAFLASGIVSAAIGALLAIPCLRVRSDFLSLVTIAFNQIFFVIANNWMDVTRGPMGIPAVPHMNLFGLDLRTPASQFWLILAVTVIIFLGVSRLTSGPIGRAWAMIRDDEVAAQALGVHVRYYKVLAFAVGCFICGLAGSLYTHYLRLVSPDMFNLDQSLLMMQMAILGGLASVPGSALGAFLMVLIPEALRSTEPWLITLRPGIAGAILVALMIWRPNGLLGKSGAAVGPLRAMRNRLALVSRGYFDSRVRAR
jgi:branched-chain amino acid transport system permease protein